MTQLKLSKLRLTKQNNVERSDRSFGNRFDLVELIVEKVLEERKFDHLRRKQHECIYLIAHRRLTSSALQN